MDGNHWYAIYKCGDHKNSQNVLSPLATIEGPSVYVLAMLDEYTKHLIANITIA